MVFEVEFDVDQRQKVFAQQHVDAEITVAGDHHSPGRALEVDHPEFVKKGDLHVGFAAGAELAVALELPACSIEPCRGRAIQLRARGARIEHDARRLSVEGAFNEQLVVLDIYRPLGQHRQLAAGAFGLGQANGCDSEDDGRHPQRAVDKPG